MLLMWDIGVGEWVWIKLVNGTEWKKIMDSNPTICEEKWQQVIQIESGDL